MNQLKQIFLLSIILGLILISEGCSFNKTAVTPTSTPPLPSPILPSTPIPFTKTPLPSDTPLPPSLTPPPSATAKTVSAFVSADALNLRNGPGKVFNAIDQTLKGDLVTVVGKAPGNDDWVLVKKADGKSGWAAVTFITVQGSLADVQELPIENAYTIRGKTLDDKNKPAEKIDIALYQNAKPDSPRTDVYSNLNGDFIAYLPKNVTGVWFISVVGYDCSSHIALPGCKFDGHFEPKNLSVDFSQIDTPIIFKYTP